MSSELNQMSAVQVAPSGERSQGRGRYGVVCRGNPVWSLVSIPERVEMKFHERRYTSTLYLTLPLHISTASCNTGDRQYIPVASSSARSKSPNDGRCIVSGSADSGQYVPELYSQQSRQTACIGNAVKHWLLAYYIYRFTASEVTTEGGIEMRLLLLLLLSWTYIVGLPFLILTHRKFCCQIVQQKAKKIPDRKL